MEQPGPPYKIDDWQAAAAAKRCELLGKIPTSHLLPPDLASRALKRELRPSEPIVLSCGILSSLDIEITEIEDAADLLQRIRGREYTSVQVVEAFAKRASIAQQCCCNCLTEILYEAALERAAELDQHLSLTGKPVGLLHGLPISLKVGECYPHPVEY